MNLNRRNFLLKSAAGTAALASIPSIVSASIPAEAGKKIVFGKGDTILFQGDSITDAGRSRKSTGPNDSAALGRGYPTVIAQAGHKVVLLK